MQISMPHAIYKKFLGTHQIGTKSHFSLFADQPHFVLGG